jgi:glutamyl-tRNA synthetase
MNSTQRASDPWPARTRLAPSPTGALHLGNARTFLVNWALARQRGWQIVLRIDDLDGPRIKRGADRVAVDLLQWIGIDWDDGPDYQSWWMDDYRAVLQQLHTLGRIYPCHCTRSEIQAASQSAPHADEHELRYPGSCRPGEPVSARLDSRLTADAAWRLLVPEGETSFDDEFAGTFSTNVQANVGDFLVATKQGTPSYQLAVVIDDARSKINRVVRGDDLLSSTPRQLLLYQALGLQPVPKYWHLPLVVGPDGRRLAKRHGDSRLSHYRQRGVAPQRIVGLLAQWCGVGPRTEMTAAEFLQRFALSRMPRQRVVFTADDERWLLEHRSRLTP